MKAQIIQFRRGRHRIHERHFILDVNVKTKEDAEKFVGKEVVWISKGKNKIEIKGKISSTHGNKGLIRAIFETGLPGQAINDEIEVK
tara:strand:- start:1080 stop:1340 length:261 start_codon:yes stop_codon:yes gene_type:complete